MAVPYRHGSLPLHCRESDDAHSHCHGDDELLFHHAQPYAHGYYSPTIRFTFFGVIAFTLASVVGLFSFAAQRRSCSCTSLNFRRRNSTWFLYAFFSMVNVWRRFTNITPRLVGCEWLSSTLIKVHFLGFRPMEAAWP